MFSAVCTVSCFAVSVPLSLAAFPPEQSMEVGSFEAEIVAKLARMAGGEEVLYYDKGM